MKWGFTNDSLIQFAVEEKLNADLAQAQQKDAGVQNYIWSSSKDQRVRECHLDFAIATGHGRNPDSVKTGIDIQCKYGYYVNNRSARF